MKIAVATLAVMLAGTSGCGPGRKPNAAGIVQTGQRVFAVLPAESERFPRAAKVATEQLRIARVKDLDAPQMSKVSLEVVQLSIECVDATPTCYAAVGKTLEANTLLFAQIDQGPKRDSVRVTVTLFDVDTREVKRTVKRVLKREADAETELGAAIAEATGP